MSSKEYAEFIRDKFSRLEEVLTIRPMMGGYVIHLGGRVLGVIDDDQLMFEPSPILDRLLPEAEKSEIFPGSKLFTVIPDDISSQKLCAIAEAIYEDLPVPKPGKKATKRPKNL